MRYLVDSTDGETHFTIMFWDDKTKLNHEEMWELAICPNCRNRAFGRMPCPHCPDKDDLIICLNCGYGCKNEAIMENGVNNENETQVRIRAALRYGQYLKE